MSLFSRRVEHRTLTHWGPWGSGAIHSNGSYGDPQERALRLAPVYSSVRLIADPISTTPFCAVRLGSDGSRTPLTSQPPLLTNPTQHGGAIAWRMRLVTSLALRGNAFGYVTGQDGLGRPAQLEWLYPGDVRLEMDDVMVPPRWYVLGRLVDPGQLIHIPLFVLPGRVLGLSPIKAFRTLIETGLQAEKFGHDWFTNGSIPSAVLETDQPVTKDQAKIIKARFVEGASGREPVVLGAGTTYKPITVPPEDSQFLQTIKATATQIAGIFGVPPDRVGGEPGGSLTYTTVAMSGDDLLRFTLRPYLARIEEALSAQLPRPQIVVADADQLTKPDALTRYQGYQIALAAGVLSRNEIRQAENMPPVEGGDTYTDPTATPPPAPVQPAQEGGGNVQP